MFLRDCISWWNEPSSTTCHQSRRGERPNCNITDVQAEHCEAWTNPGGERKEQVSSTNDAAASSRGRRYPKDCISRERERKTRKITIIQIILPQKQLILCLYKYNIPPPHMICITYFRDEQMHRLNSDWLYTIAKINKVCFRIMFKIIETIHRKKLGKHGCLNDRRNLLQIVYFFVSNLFQKQIGPKHRKNCLLLMFIVFIVRSQWQLNPCDWNSQVVIFTNLHW